MVLWLVALVGTFAATRAAGTNFSTRFQLADTQSAQALSLLQKDFLAASGSSARSSCMPRPAPCATRP